MIGSFTEKTIDAVNFTVTYFLLRWTLSDTAYEELRRDAAELLGKLEVDFDLPPTKAAYDAQARALNAAVTSALARERTFMNGDTIALPLYLLSSSAFYAAMLIALGEEREQSEDLRMLMQMIDAVLEDLGLDPSLRESFDRDADWLTISAEEVDGEPTVSKADVLRVGASFNMRVVEELDRRERELDVRAALGGLADEVRGLRDEQRTLAENLPKLLAARDGEVVALLSEVKAALVDQGVSAEEAEALTGDPETLARRLYRWLRSDDARDAGEEALWAALEFVPGGTAVKLGVRISRAVRTSLRD